MLNMLSKTATQKIYAGSLRQMGAKLSLMGIQFEIFS